MSNIVIGAVTVEIPTLTVEDCRDWMEYMRGVGESAEADIIGGSVLEHLTVHELCYLLQDVGDGELESMPLDQLAGIEAAFIDENQQFINMRRRIVRAGESVLSAK